MGKGSHAVPHRSFLQSKSLLKVVLGHARRRPLNNDSLLQTHKFTKETGLTF
ncbi:hypothetical protein M404DRAFT_1000325 [Pisolithus tinctorius Marx 270]|uniref:Uncharacterized protein n=1 Tax=Pisolithus tinctorius Marx 270 TaxID=870435 RepID=A0A0C3PA79_PISTI|nr:hypothetical protein M404DRAFT_1000325 [Pisolithus tinctorius Marx 270]